MARSRKNKSARKVDFSEEVKYFEADEDVELVVKKATWEDGDQYPYIAIEFNGVGEYEEATLYHNASTSPKALFRLRALLEALGMEVPEGELDIDTDELEGMRCMGHTFEDRYKGDDGKTKSNIKVDDFWPVDENEKKSDKKGAGKKSSKKDDDDEKLDRDEVEKMKRKALVALIEEHELDVDADSKKLKKDDDALREAVIEALEEKDLLEEAGGEEEDEVEKLDKSEIEGMTRKKLLALIKEHDLDDVDPSSKKLKKDDEALAAAVIEALEEKDMIAEEDDEEDKKGKAGSKRGSGKSKKGQTWSEEDIQDMDEEQLQEVIDKSKVEVDLDDFRTLRKKKNAVIDALGDADLLDK